MRLSQNTSILEMYKIIFKVCMKHKLFFNLRSALKIALSMYKYSKQKQSEPLQVRDT